MKPLYLICLVLFLLVSQTEVKSQWQTCSGLEGGSSNSILYSDSMVLVSVHPGGIYRSDLSSPWEKGNSLALGNLFKAGNCLFTGSGSYGLARSLDNGLNWEYPPTFILPRSACAVDSVVFFEFHDFIARSFNYIDTLEILINLPELEWPYVLSDDSLLLVIDDHNMLIYQSLNLGDQWDSITTNGLALSNYNYFLMASYSNTIILAGNFGSYYLNETRDEWIEIPDPVDNFSVYSFYERDGQLLCGHNSPGIYYLDLNQPAWILYAESPFTILDMCEKGNLLCCATADGPSLLDEAGEFHPFYDGLYHRDVSSLSVLNDSIYVIADESLYKSTDNGLVFNKYDNVIGKQILATDSIIYLLTDHSILSTSDDFITIYSYNIPAGSRALRLSITDKYFYLITDLGCFRSMISSPFWIELTNDLGGKFSYIAAIDPVVVANDVNNKGIYLSDDNGNHFEKIFHVDGSAPIGVTDSSFYVLTADSILFSNNLGNSWEIITVEYQHCKIHVADFSESAILYGGAHVVTPFLSFSFDFGQSWQDLLDNLPNGAYPNFYSVNINNERLFVSSKYYSLWYRDDILTRIPSQPQLTKDGTDLRIFPNPSRNNLTIEANNLIGGEQYRVVNISGLTIQTGRVLTERTRLDICDFEVGIYIIQVWNHEKTYSKKFIKH